MPTELAKETRNALKRAQEISIELNHHYLGVEHLFLSLMERHPSFLASLPFDPQRIRISFRETLPQGDPNPPWKGVPHTPRMEKILKMGADEARSASSSTVEPRHLLRAIFKEGSSLPCAFLREEGYQPEELIGLLPAAPLRDVGVKVFYPVGKPQEKGPLHPLPATPPLLPDVTPPGIVQKPQKPERLPPTPLLNRLGRDLVALAREGKLDPLIGRKDEVRRVMQILTRRTKNNPLILGEAGVGKTAIVAGLAQRIAQGQVPKLLENKKIIEINVASLLAGTKHRGEFEERLEKLLEEVKSAPDVIVFIDEIHTIVGAGDSKGALDIGNIFKPVLARGEFPLIGATTTDEYRKHMADDTALDRRFQPVLVAEPAEEETLEILNGLKEKFEKHHGVTLPRETLRAAVKLSVRYLTERHLPDKALDLIDEAASKVKMQGATQGGVRQGEESGSGALVEVTPEAVAEVVSSWTGVPVAKLSEDESRKLIGMEEYLKTRVIGQEEATEKVAKTIKMVRVGLGAPGRPGGVFLFLGPTGVGKTELAKTLAEFLFGSEKMMIRIDMSEYMEKHTVSRLIGAPPGYIGHEEEGQLTKAVRDHPYSVILFDEVEKAHPEVFDLFLQVFEDGRLTDSKGRTVNFTNAVIIMTSNIGSQHIMQVLEKPGKEKGLGFRVQRDEIPIEQKYERVAKKVMEEVKQTLRPELINRIDEMVIFKPLGMEELKKIVELNLQDLRELLREKGISLQLSETAMDLLLEQGYDQSLGARPLKRAIQNLLSKPMAEELLMGTIKEGDRIRAEREGEKLIFAAGSALAKSESEDDKGGEHAGQD